MSDSVTGFAFPLRADQTTGGFRLASGADKLRQNIVQLLLTEVGERVMRRDYGGGLRTIVHDPNNDALRAVVQHQLGKAIREWEPRAQLLQVVITQDPEAGTLLAEVQYAARPNLVPTSVRVPIQGGAV